MNGLIFSPEHARTMNTLLQVIQTFDNPEIIAIGTESVVSSTKNADQVYKDQDRFVNKLRYVFHELRTAQNYNLNEVLNTQGLK